MELSRDSGNNIKHGRIWMYLDENYSKNIGIEWSLRFNPMNFYISLDGGEHHYTFSFWCIFTFYITFSNVFKYYPKEWNSMTNNKKGGYLDTATRKIGISQYHWSIALYLWHDGENSWDKDKCDKIWYKWIDVFDILCGSWKYHTIEEDNYDEYLHLNEGKKKINIQYRFWHKKYKRFYMRIFNHKGKSLTVKSDIKYPVRKQTQEDLDDIKKHDFPEDDLEREVKNMSYSLKADDDNKVIIEKYRNYIMELRKCESYNWIPFEFRKGVNREEKLKDILG